jgi:hypothetical protein
VEVQGQSGKAITAETARFMAAVVVVVLAALVLTTTQHLDSTLTADPV